MPSDYHGRVVQYSIDSFEALSEKRPEYASRHDCVIFNHDNARPYVAKPISIENSGWGVLSFPTYSLALYYFYLFRSIWNVLTETRFTSNQGI